MWRKTQVCPFHDVSLELGISQTTLHRILHKDLEEMDVTCIKNFIINRALQVKLFLNHKNTSLHVFECYLHLDSCADEKLNKVKLPAKKNKI